MQWRREPQYPRYPGRPRVIDKEQGTVSIRGIQPRRRDGSKEVTISSRSCSGDVLGQRKRGHSHEAFVGQYCQWRKRTRPYHLLMHCSLTRRDVRPTRSNMTRVRISLRNFEYQFELLTWRGKKINRHMKQNGREMPHPPDKRRGEKYK